MAEKKYAPGQHPNSRANLNYHEGRPVAFGSRKKTRSITVSEEGWEGAQAVVRELGCSSVSEFMEKLGRGQIKLSA